MPLEQFREGETFRETLECMNVEFKFLAQFPWHIYVNHLGLIANLSQLHPHLVPFFVFFQVEEESLLCAIYESNYNPIMKRPWT